MSGLTPGPWFIGPINADHWRRIGPTEKPDENEPAIAFVFGLEPDHAHLIAAAPDLLAALRGSTCAACDRLVGAAYDLGLTDCESCRESHAAITKAEGRQA